MIRAHLFISGRVQCVFFRSTMCQKARQFNIYGFVKNLPDGNVEAVLEGEEEKVEKLVEWAKKGTFLAKVKEIEIIKEDYKGEFENFEIIY